MQSEETPVEMGYWVCLGCGLRFKQPVNSVVPCPCAKSEMMEITRDQFIYGPDGKPND